MKHLLTIILISVCYSANAEVVSETGSINNIKVIHWADNRACICIGSEWFKLDLSSEQGKASYSLALLGKL